ncbi:CpsD/CapB family tyrosine-protein kinase [Halanaerobium congolense]|jgi:capsular exopolysaccharide synthesis family protein|uniref:CpsD/CapB family tyrosine-protein kinase n=1 Tax=Halanaerobium congolense TaxID=54121 RepID=UPI00088E2CCD|nr:CpsD/CapB family tyrosine-protein kinase [Halanaerobium congolense]SDK72536.1 capsular exopolysaccharide family [Halanaerobium congolense]SDL85975.1 capsular exopolysaccharide family [Halanaerobium congolense]
MAKKKNKKQEISSDKLVALHHKKSPATEAFRTIRTNLQFMSPDKELKVIMVTGSEAGIGKSTVASNLALTFSMTGQKTLLIDTDMRKPMLHKLFDLPNFQGLSSYLAGDQDEIEDLIQECKHSGTFLLPAGPIPPNPSEMLNSKKMEDLIKKCKKESAITIIDAPPLLLVTDALLLSQKVDGVIMVAETNQTKKEVFTKGIERLQQVNANILGTILNKYPVNKSSYYTYENYYYYGEE